MKRFSVILILIAGFLLALPACAGDLMVSRAMLKDAAGTLTIQEVEKREFIPIGTTLSEGYTDAVHWLRLKVRARAKGREVVLRIHPAFLDEIRLYSPDPGNPQGWRTRVTGDLYADDPRDRIAAALEFVVEVAEPEAIFYLRLKTSSTSLLNVEALTPLEADGKDRQFDLLMGLFVAVMVGILLWAVQDYALLGRNPTVGLFGVYLAFYTLWGVANAGYFVHLAPAGWPEFSHWSSAILAFSMAFLFRLFSRSLLLSYSPPPVLQRGMDLLLWVFPFQLAALLLGYERLALTMNVSMIFLDRCYFAFVAFSLREEQIPSRRLVLGVYLALVALAAISFFNFFGWTFADFGQRGAMLMIINGFAISGLMAMILGMRSLQLQRKAHESALALAVSLKTIDLERELREKAEEQARTDHLTGLFNRRYFMGQAERELARAKRYQKPLSLLMIDIDHFKSVNDTWGHAAGNLVLQGVSRIFVKMLREVDIVGRLGGEEFAVLLTETDAAHAMLVAERLREMIEQAVMTPPNGETLRITVSLGLAALNARDINLDQLFGEADVALYRAKQSGRNRTVISE